MLLRLLKDVHLVQCAAMIPRILSFILIGLLTLPVLAGTAGAPSVPGLGVDVDFYTGPVSHDIWLKMKQSGIQFVIAQAWEAVAATNLPFPSWKRLAPSPA